VFDNANRTDESKSKCVDEKCPPAQRYWAKAGKCVTKTEKYNGRTPNFLLLSQTHGDCKTKTLLKERRSHSFLAPESE
jgi:hypothetical protein